VLIAIAVRAISGDLHAGRLPFPRPPAGIPKPVDGVEPAPGFFEAIQQQLGLKLAAEKTQVDVLAIDHVEKPSAN
jgi:uncharacterized protein (TIGR03435 family)